MEFLKRSSRLQRQRQSQTSLQKFQAAENHESSKNFIQVGVFFSYISLNINVYNKLITQAQQVKLIMKMIGRSRARSNSTAKTNMFIIALSVCLNTYVYYTIHIAYIMLYNTVYIILFYTFSCIRVTPHVFFFAVSTWGPTSSPLSLSLTYLNIILTQSNFH